MNDILEKVRALRISDFDYPLPDERIARHPLAEREQCKLLCYGTGGGDIAEHRFADVPSLLPPDALLVYNNTRVINARVVLRKSTGSPIEIFCLEPVEPRDYALVFQTTARCTWLCLVGNSKRWKQGALSATVTLDDGRTVTLSATRDDVPRGGGAWHVTFEWDNPSVTFASLIEAVGKIPIPPYLNRDTEPSDAEDYQTVYSRINGSVAAPTAGLHFTPSLLDELDRRGIGRRELTLHVGAGTFQPVKSEHIGGHPMHHELYVVTRDLIAELAATTRPVVAVGTTSVRTLESLYYVGQILEADPEAADLSVTQWMPYTTPCRLSTREALANIVAYLDARGLDRLVASTQLMIAPGFRYRLVRGMITNFHQPQSTLLLLVAAFVGEDRWRALYDYALAHGFRFLSYGDACYLRTTPREGVS